MDRALIRSHITASPHFLTHLHAHTCNPTHLVVLVHGPRLDQVQVVGHLAQQRHQRQHQALGAGVQPPAPLIGGLFAATRLVALAALRLDCKGFALLGICLITLGPGATAGLGTKMLQACVVERLAMGAVKEGGDASCKRSHCIEALCVQRRLLPSSFSKVGDPLLPAALYTPTTSVP